MFLNKKFFRPIVMLGRTGKRMLGYVLWPMIFLSKQVARRFGFLKEKFRSSVSRDYHILASVILFVAIAFSAWWVLKLHSSKERALQQRVSSYANLVDSELTNYFNSISHIAEDKAHKIVMRGENDLENIDFLFRRRFFLPKTPDALARNRIFRWPNLSWVNKERYLIVRSDRGVLKEPQKFDAGNYLYNARIFPWQLHLSDPIFDSNKQNTYLKGALGVDNENEEHIGSIIMEFEIDKVVDSVSKSIDKDDLFFVVLSLTFDPVMQSNNIQLEGKPEFYGKLKGEEIEPAKSKIFAEPLEYGEKTFLSYRRSESYPFIILIGYDEEVYADQILSEVIRWFLVLGSGTVFVLASLYWFSRRMVSPVSRLARAAKHIEEGDYDKVYIKKKLKGSPRQMEDLRKALSKIKDTSKDLDERNKDLKEANKKLKKLKQVLEEERKAAVESKYTRDKYLSEIRAKIIGSMNIIMEIVSRCLAREVLKSADDEAIEDLMIAVRTLNASMLPSSTEDMELSKVDMNKTLDSCVKIQADDAQIKGIKINVEKEKKLPLMHTDEFIIHQIFLALLYRAIEDLDVAKNEKNIWIKTKLIHDGKDKSFCLTIKDNGIGMSQKAVRKVLNDYKTKIEFSANSNGTDLGLSSVKHLIDVHGGTLDIESVEKQGTTFTVVIPYIDRSQKKEKTEVDRPLIPNKVIAKNKESKTSYPEKGLAKKKPKKVIDLKSYRKDS